MLTFAALLQGAQRALRVALLPPWASRTLGLYIATRACQDLVIPRHTQATKAAPDALPVDWKDGGGAYGARG